MADTYRYRFGETNPVQAPRKDGVAVSIGDLVMQDETDGYTVKPASSEAFAAGGFGTTQTNFVTHFLGVCGQRWDGSSKTTGSSDGQLRVATEGIYEFDVAAGTTLKAGALVGPALAASGSALENQKVVAVAARSQAIGRVERDVSSGSKVLVRIFSARLGNLTN